MTEISNNDFDIVRRIAYANYIEILHGKPQKEINKITANIEILKNFKIPADYNDKLYNKNADLLKILKKLQKFHIPSLNEDSIKLEIFKFFNIFHKLSTILQIFNNKLTSQNKSNEDFTKAIKIVKDILSKFTSEYTKYIQCEEGENVDSYIEKWRDYADKPNDQQKKEAEKKLEDMKKKPAFVRFFKKLSSKYKKSRENAKQIIEDWNNDIQNIARLNRKNLNYLKITEKQITDLMKQIHSTFYVENTSLMYAFIKINKFISEYDKENKYPGLIAPLIMRIPLGLELFKSLWFKDYSGDQDNIKPLFVEEGEEKEVITIENVHEDVSEFFKFAEKSFAFYLENLFQQHFINDEFPKLEEILAKADVENLDEELGKELEKFVKFSSVMETRRAYLKVLQDELDALKKILNKTDSQEDRIKEISLLIEKLEKSPAVKLCKDENSTCCAEKDTNKKEECATKKHDDCNEPCKRRYEHDIDSIDRMDIDGINDQEKQTQKNSRSRFNTKSRLSEVEQFPIGKEKMLQGNLPAGEAGKGVAETREKEYRDFLKNKKKQKKEMLEKLRKQIKDHMKNVEARKQNSKKP